MQAVSPWFPFSISQFFQSWFNVALARMVPLPVFRLYCYVVGLSYLALRTDHRQPVATGVLSNLPYLTKASPPSSGINGERWPPSCAHMRSVAPEES